MFGTLFEIYLSSMVMATCFVIAAPIAWYGVKLTVTFQNWKAANANPVKSNQSE